jgi:hypothetical protein
MEQVSDAKPGACMADRPGIGRLKSSQDANQGRFATAIRADQSEAIACGDPERDVL